MASDDAARRYQAEHHELVHQGDPQSPEETVLRLIHGKAYAVAAQVGADLSVLDVGCNVGYGTALLGETSPLTVGVDVSSKALRYASRHYGAQDRLFVMADGASLPFPEERFHLLVAFQFLEHLPFWSGFLAEAARVIHRDGVVMITTPNRLIRLGDGERPWNPMHVREFTPSELGAILGEQFGFVRVFGLTGSPAVRSIELARLQKARRRARLRRLGKFTYSIARSLYRTSRWLFRWTWAPRKDGGLRASGETIHSLSDLYYSQANLETSLDLLAVCSRTEGGATRALEALQSMPGDRSSS